MNAEADILKPVVVLDKGNGNGKPRNLSTIAIHTTRGMIHASVVNNWMSLFTKMNHQFVTFIMAEQDADTALNVCIEKILEQEALAKFQYVLLHEDDNIAPLDGFLTLVDSIGDYDALGGLYVTKDPAHWPLILGDPEKPRDFTPQYHLVDGAIHECNGTGTGFVLIKMDVFKKLPKPWFRSVEKPDANEPGIRRMQHDLYFFWKMKQAGMKIAVHTGVRVGHLDVSTGECFYPSEPVKESQHG